MAYTAPTDLFTSEEAILSLASSIADEDRTNLGNGTINGALDVLADALADQNVEVPPMNAGAILALADYVSGGGGGGSATTDVWLWNGETGDYSELIPSKVEYLADFDGTMEVYSQLSFEHVTETFQGMTIHGIRVKDVPVGACITLDSDMALTFSIYYSQSAFPPQRIGVVETLLCPMPIDGFVIAGLYRLGM